MSAVGGGPRRTCRSSPVASRPFYSLHTHSRYSVNDALSKVPDMVGRAAELGYPALALTDHGSVAGNLQLYKECRRRGMEPLPGVELYVTPDREQRIQGHNLHLTVLAYSERGYRNLCRMITSTARNFHYKPRIDMADLAAMAEDDALGGLAVTTGCWFGLLPTVMREQGPAAAEHVVNTLAGWFPKVFVELQAHGVEQEEFGEDEMVNALVELSSRTGIPYVITTDAHYVRAQQQPLHDGLKRLCSWSDDPDDAVFPGGPYCLLNESDLKSYFEPSIVAGTCETLSDFAEQIGVRLPELEKFKMLIPDVTVSGDADAELRILAEQGFDRLVPKDAPPKEIAAARERMEFELDTVAKTGFASYLLLIAQVCTFMREKEIVFFARGSANNFFINWLCGITNVDSYSWDLRPERFISIDRIKPPDIDLDIEHERRKEVTDWAATQFTVCQVGTLAKYSLFDEDEDGKGSLRKRYYSIARKAGREPPEWRFLPERDKEMLVELSKQQLISGYGTHAAGLILAPDEASISHLPMTRVGSGSTAHLVTCYDKETIEDLGFIKCDFLGSATITAAALCIREISDLAPADYLDTIPLNDKEVYKRISEGRTDGTFQLQERPATAFCRRMRPRNIRDLIASMALMRPAARMSGTDDTYLARRRGQEERPNLHPDLAKETEGTYGTILYQEQVIGALRVIGMDMPELNKLLKAIKASNEYTVGAAEVIAEALPRIKTLAETRGWSDSDVKIIMKAVEGYADYGFNEGHAVAYGLMAYRTAWLATHYPNEWWYGVLTAYSNHDLEPRYVIAARREGVRLVPPHVNRSKMRYSVDRKSNAVRKGLLSVKGVGLVAARELADKAPYESLEDLGKRVIPKRVSGAKGLVLHKNPIECGGVIAALADVGALDGLE